MVSAPSSSLSAGCLLRHHPEACTDPSMQRVLLSLQKRVVGVFKERLHSVTHFSSLKGWPAFTWAALCLAPRWSRGKSFLCLCVPVSCLPPGLPAFSSWCTCFSSAEADGGGGNLCTRQTPRPCSEGNSWSPPLLSCAGPVPALRWDPVVPTVGRPTSEGRLWHLNRTGCNFQN